MLVKSMTYCNIQGVLTCVKRKFFFYSAEVCFRHDIQIAKVFPSLFIYARMNDIKEGGFLQWGKQVCLKQEERK
ncbi:hypothetical protein FGO68_gene14206 [Halteria grandinella]|uniref:Uncharacterized protein n=1 Tax=Halteria grandinella TaxID=5974 RepID=A0A8J8TB11_HALGN|nr:hypothetical protein FGO68_gene14206 [Halteria grandinella]